PQVLGEAKIGHDGTAVFFAVTASRVDVNDIQFGVKAAGHARGASDKVLTGRIRTDADGDALAYSPVFLNVLRSHIIVQAAVDLFGNLAQGEFAQRDEIAASKEIAKGLLDLGRRVDVAAPHAILQSFGREVNHHGFTGGHGNPIRNRFPNGDPRNVANR